MQKNQYLLLVILLIAKSSYSSYAEKKAGEKLNQTQPIISVHLNVNPNYTATPKVMALAEQYAVAFAK